MRLRAVTRIGLKRALSLHAILWKLNEPPMLANAFSRCQSRRSVLQSASFPERLSVPGFHVRLVSSQKFSTPVEKTVEIR